MPIGPPCMHRSIARLQGRRGCKQLPGGVKSGWLKPIDCRNSTQREVECGGLSQLAGDATLAFVKQQLGIDLCCRLGNKLALQCQYIIHLPIKLMRPEHFTSGVKIE